MTYRLHAEYFEILGYELAKNNFGKPTDPSIEVNPEKSSFQIPQAWSQDIAGETHWFYNLPWAEMEATALGVTIPTLEEYLQICADIPGDAVEKAQMLNMPLNGYRNMNTGEIVSQWKRAAIWTSTRDGNTMSDSICLQISCNHAHGNLYGNALWLSVRSFI